MAPQESSSTSETPPRPTLKKTFLQSTIASLRVVFVFSKTLPFIGGLVVSYKYVEIVVLSSLTDYLSGSGGKNDERIAVILTNLQDGVSSILFVFISLIIEAYTDSFTAISFCAAASIQGLMLLWTSTSTSFGVVYAAIFLLSLGNSGQKLVESFYDNQLQERIKEKRRQGEEDAIHWSIWLLAPLIVGYSISLSFVFLNNYYDDNVRIGALLMGGTYLFFLFGSIWYKPEELNVDESNLHKIYRICRAAFGKRELKYPTSLDCYYWKDSMQGNVYDCNEGKRLLPRVPRLFRWLDRAAIVNAEEESSDFEVSLVTQEKNGKLCTVKEVREVKSLVPMIYLGCFIVPYCLLVATGNTFFVSQASSMTPNITRNGNDISILFLIMEGMKDMSKFICFIISIAFRRLRKFKAINYMNKRKVGKIIRIGFGMVCGVICSFIAWHVERHRLSLPFIRDEEGELKRGKTSALVPQFIMLGMTEELVVKGSGSLFRDNVAKSMWSFEKSFNELVTGTGKLLIIPLVLIFGSWFKQSDNTSHLNRFYLMLAILNSTIFPCFVYYSIKYACKEECLQDEQLTMEDHQHSDSGDHSNQEDSNANPVNQGIQCHPENADIENQRISIHLNESESTYSDHDNDDNISSVTPKTFENDLDETITQMRTFKARSINSSMGRDEDRSAAPRKRNSFKFISDNI